MCYCDECLSSSSTNQGTSKVSNFLITTLSVGVSRNEVDGAITVFVCDRDVGLGIARNHRSDYVLYFLSRETYI